MLAAVGLEGIHLHDLRHSGNQLTANAVASPKELMARMGHDSERAALIRLHSTAERQRALADAVGESARAELAKSMPRKAAKPSATRAARNRRSSEETGKWPAPRPRLERETYRTEGGKSKATSWCATWSSQRVRAIWAAGSTTARS